MYSGALIGLTGCFRSTGDRMFGDIRTYEDRRYRGNREYRYMYIQNKNTVLTCTHVMYISIVDTIGAIVNKWVLHV